MKNVQIPYELFVSLLRYHLLEDDDCLKESRQELELKSDAFVWHKKYIDFVPYTTGGKRGIDKRVLVKKSVIRF